MSDHIRFFSNGVSTSAVALPIDYHEAIDDWSDLRKRMIRVVPRSFTRDEWAYLVTFLETGNLLDVFLDAFGTETPVAHGEIKRLYRPRGPIAVWLPNNVSLLGPLTLILLSLTGQRIRLKMGSAAKDLAGEFLEFALTNLRPGEMRDYLATMVTAESFPREDERQAVMASSSEIRIVFGSDQAATDIHDLPHPLSSSGFSFTDRQSEAWIEKGALNEDVLTSLIKVFAIYGQAGCTSPRRVILLDGSEQDVVALRENLAQLWPEVIKQDPPMHVASSNILADQYARSLDWETATTARNSALLANGALSLPRFEAPLALCLHAASREEALAALPPNIQTIGHALEKPDDPAWLQMLAGSKVLRFVPLGQVHHFNNSWDGREFWRQCFESMEVRL